MPETQAEVKIRALEDTDLEDIVALDEKMTGTYRPEIWERRLVYYQRRDPEGSAVAEVGGRLVGFMLGELRSGEFGLEEPSGWIEVMGVDPEERGKAIGRRLAEHLLAHFRNRGAATVRTLVDEDMVEIASFFTALGFQPGKMRPFVKELSGLTAERAT